VWRSRKNEIFHFCLQGNVSAHNASIDAYLRALHWASLPHDIVNDRMLAGGELDGLKLLVMPACYYLTREEAVALDRWVRAGGVLLCEAHLAGYDGTGGRHARVVPGCGLAASWGLWEQESTAAVHLPRADDASFDAAALSDDVRKALRGSGRTGSPFYPIRLCDGTVVLGAHRYAELAGDGLEPLGSFGDAAPCLVRKRVGAGTVFYCGTNLGIAAGQSAAGLETLLAMAVTAAGVEPAGGMRAGLAGTARLDLLYEDGRPRFAVLASRAEREQSIRVSGAGRWRGLFTGTTYELEGATAIDLPAGFRDLFVVEDDGG
jgi:hypothetical protein